MPAPASATTRPAPPRPRGKGVAALRAAAVAAVAAEAVGTDAPAARDARLITPPPLTTPPPAPVVRVNGVAHQGSPAAPAVTPESDIAATSARVCRVCERPLDWRDALYVPETGVYAGLCKRCASGRHRARLRGAYLQVTAPRRPAAAPTPEPRAFERAATARQGATAIRLPQRPWATPGRAMATA